MRGRGEGSDRAFSCGHQWRAERAVRQLDLLGTGSGEGPAARQLDRPQCRRKGEKQGSRRATISSAEKDGCARPHRLT